MIEASGKTVECPICIASIAKGKLRITHCGHKFCEDCAIEMGKNRMNACAVCRSKVYW